MKIIGLPNDHLPTLSERRDELTKKEFLKIQADESHPCHELLPNVKTHNYNLRNKSNLNVVKSGTDRHKNSFIPRACRIVYP